ncbi:hypothetical protein PPYR_02996 [Photinus pyralis]|uniref:Uncharacterized protein n=2 Tax=Photinus pyralis TaxID=7054 RepID=A0A5N4A1M0_PHOPY|nr:uncharacterized protein LOC116162515 isoform X2 [Photinus pyralis]KAB0791196.1 hypothetical protein PPYR_02996 [Photinus pyralis]
MFSRHLRELYLMQPQYGQGAAPSHHPPPFAPPEVSGNGGSVTSSLRQWRKKDYVEKKSPEESSPPANENPSHIARVAPHTYYPRPPDDQCNYQHHYGDYSLSYKPTGPVKYSEIVESQQTQTIEHITPVIQKHKEKEYVELCSGPSQAHHVPMKQSAYPEPPLSHQYIPKDSQIHPFLQKPSQMPQYMQKEPYQQFLSKYNMQNQYSQPYPSEPNNFLAHLNKINPRMAQSIINDTHLRESQIPMYHNLDHNRPYPQSQRMYHPSSMPPNPAHSQRNLPPSYNYPQSYNYNVKPNIPPVDPYSRPYQHNVPKYLPEQPLPNISPQHLYNESMHMNYGPYPSSKLSPNYSQLEYAQHYQHRRQLPHEYYTHPPFKDSFAQNPQLSPEDLGAEPGSRKPSLKQYLESWVEENISGNLPEMIANNTIADMEQLKTALQAKSGDAQDQPLYVLDTTEITNDSLPQFLHLQQFEKLPENIRGYYTSTASVPHEARQVIVENKGAESYTNPCSLLAKPLVESCNLVDKSLENKVVEIHIVEDSEAADLSGGIMVNAPKQGESVIKMCASVQEDDSNHSSGDSYKSMPDIEQEGEVSPRLAESPAEQPVDLAISTVEDDVTSPVNLTQEVQGENATADVSSLDKFLEEIVGGSAKDDVETPVNCLNEVAEKMQEEVIPELTAAEASPVSMCATEDVEEEARQVDEAIPHEEASVTEEPAAIEQTEEGLENEISLSAALTTDKVDEIETLPATALLAEERASESVEEPEASEMVDEMETPPAPTLVEKGDETDIPSITALPVEVESEPASREESDIAESRSTRDKTPPLAVDEPTPVLNVDRKRWRMHKIESGRRSKREAVEKRERRLKRYKTQIRAETIRGVEKRCKRDKIDIPLERAVAEISVEETVQSENNDSSRGDNVAILSEEASLGDLTEIPPNTVEETEGKIEKNDRSWKRKSTDEEATALPEIPPNAEEEADKNEATAQNERISKEDPPEIPLNVVEETVLDVERKWEMDKTETPPSAECTIEEPTAPAAAGTIEEPTASAAVEESELKRKKDRKKDRRERTKKKKHLEDPPHFVDQKCEESVVNIEEPRSEVVEDLPVAIEDSEEMPVLEKATYDESEANIVYHINDSNVVLQIADELLEINVTVQNGKKLILVKTFSDAVIMNNTDSCPILEDQTTVVQTKPPPVEHPVLDNYANVTVDNVEMYVKEICEGPDIPIENEVCVFNEEVVSSSTEAGSLPKAATEQAPAPTAPEEKKVEKKKSPKKKTVTWLDQAEPKRCLDTKPTFPKTPKTKAALKLIEPHQTKMKDHCVPSKTKSSIAEKIAKLKKPPRLDGNKPTKQQKAEKPKKNESHPRSIPKPKERTKPKKPIADPRKAKFFSRQAPVNIDSLYRMSIEPENLAKIQKEPEVVKAKIDVEEPQPPLISVQENSITSSTCQETEATQRERANKLIQQINDDWEDEEDGGKIVESNTRRLSLQEYNDRKRTGSLTEPERCSFAGPDLTSNLLGNVAGIRRKVSPKSPELSVKFINKTYSRTSSFESGSPPHKTEESLSSSIELQLPKRNRVLPTPNYNQEYLKKALMNDLHTVNQITATLIRENQELMRRFLEQQRLTAGELKKVKQIIRYKRLVQHLTTMRVKEVEPNNNVIRRESPVSTGERRRKRRFRFLYSDDEYEGDSSNSSPLIVNDTCLKRARVENLVPDYSVHQSNSQGQLTLVFKRNVKSDPRMQPFVKLERLPSLDRLALNL